MPVRGSYRDDRGFDPKNVDLMCHATTRQSVDKIQELVQDKTPVKSGKLRESVETTPTTKPYSTWYKAKVESKDFKVEWIEYGTPPHIIQPRGKKSLAFGGPHPYAVVHHPGAEGRHMFTRGGEEFRSLHAERIAKSNARKFLGARTVV